MAVRSLSLLRRQYRGRTFGLHPCSPDSRSTGTQRSLLHLCHRFRSSGPGSAACAIASRLQPTAWVEGKRSSWQIQFDFLPVQRNILFTINILLKFCASASFATIYLFSTELFPTNLRTTSIGICSMIGRLGAILGTFSNDYLVSSWMRTCEYPCFRHRRASRSDCRWPCAAWSRCLLGLRRASFQKHWTNHCRRLWKMWKTSA